MFVSAAWLLFIGLDFCSSGHMVGRGELTDKAWEAISPLLPANGKGRRWRDHRQVINGILGELRTGAPWRDVPDRYGPRKTCHERFRTWTMDGTWATILDEAVVKDDATGDLEWVVSVDSTSVRAHQHAAGARKKGAALIRSRTLQWPENASADPAQD